MAENLQAALEPCGRVSCSLARGRCVRVAEGEPASMNEDSHAAPESPESASEEGDRVLAELPDQLARARAIVRQAREQLSVHMSSSGTDDGV